MLRSMSRRAATHAVATGRARYHTALGSLREVLACFEVGAALGYLPEVEPASEAASTTCSGHWCDSRAVTDARAHARLTGRA